MDMNIDFSYYAGKSFQFLNSNYTFKVIYFSLITTYSLFICKPEEEKIY